MEQCLRRWHTIKPTSGQCNAVFDGERIFLYRHPSRHEKLNQCWFNVSCLLGSANDVSIRPCSIRTNLKPVYQFKAFWLTKPSNLSAWRFGRWILNRVCQTIHFFGSSCFQLGCNLDLESDCQTMWFLRLKLVLYVGWQQHCTAINSRRSFRAYKSDHD